MTNHLSNNHPDIVDHISTNQSLAMAVRNMNLECIIPIFAERTENLQDPRLNRNFSEGRSQLQEHCLKPVRFGLCPQGNVDNNLQPEAYCNREWPLALVDIMECSGADDNSKAEHCLPTLRAHSDIPFLSPTFSPEPSSPEPECHSPDVKSENGSSSMLEHSSNHGGQAHPIAAEKESLGNSRPNSPSCEVGELSEPNPTGGTHLYERQNNQLANGTVLDIGHIRRTQYSSNTVISWQSRLDITFSSETGRSYPCEQNMWPGRIIPLNPVTEERLQDPRLAPTVFRSAFVGQFTFRQADFQSSQRECVAFAREFSDGKITRFSPADNRVADFADTSGRQSNGIAGATPAENHVQDSVHIKRESQEIGALEEKNKNEARPSQAQIEQWLAANQRLWGHCFIQSPEAPSEELQSAYSPSSVLSPLFSPDVLLSPSSPSSPIERQPPDSNKQAPAESELVLSEQKSQAHPPEQNCEPTPAGPEPSQALPQRCDSESIPHWPPAAYWSPLQPSWPHMSSAQRSLYVARTHPPTPFVAQSEGPLFAAEAPVTVQSAKPVGHSLPLLAPNGPAYPSVFQPTRQGLLQHPECYPAPPPFLPPSQEQVPLLTSVPHQPPEEHTFSFLPTQLQVRSAHLQPPAYYDPAPVAPPALQTLAVPQTLGTESSILTNAARSGHTDGNISATTNRIFIWRCTNVRSWIRGQAANSSTRTGLGISTNADRIRFTT
ncbi:arginine-glutamic acid dipeptide repeats protein isoform X2 [Dermacentor silvarum]|uniref:arginine-glutamic acid dipeptide repeats protein isoform X2 n=1 Tax=Dermacentor silvarum TaxID=543639 RepID=UPI00189AC2EA|nr:arginine-glutamic acid dipeptide repeats protein isoform X2 [Dermacentor silvarum]